MNHAILGINDVREFVIINIENIRLILRIICFTAILNERCVEEGANSNKSKAHVQYLRALILLPFSDELREFPLAGLEEFL